MPSKDVKPKTRLGKSNPRRVKIAVWIIGLSFCVGGVYAAYRFTAPAEIEVPVARARRGDFIISVRTRGDIKSARSTILKAPQVPNLRIVRLAENGRGINKGDVVVEFDSMQQEQNVLNRGNSVTSADGDIVQLKANQKMSNEADSMNKVTSEYTLEKAKLDASKAEILSAIDGEKNRIQVTVSEGALQQVKAVINAHEVGNQADLARLANRKDKAVRDLRTAEGYLQRMRLTAPVGGIVNVLPNFRSQGQFGQSQPPFKEGDNVWTGAEIAEIPDLSEMYVDLKLEEVDRGKLKMGQFVKVRVDAIPDKEFQAQIDYISPIANLVFRGGAMADKKFPARATLKGSDSRLRPGMSSTAEIIIERQPNQLLIPVRSSFDKEGKPIVYVQAGKNFAVRSVEIGPRNEEDQIIKNGLKEGDLVALESPLDAARRARKKL